MTGTSASGRSDTQSGSPMLVVLTGGVASGKSAVSDILEKLGVPVVDTDVIARQVVAPASPGLARVVAEFGTGVLHENGTLDRKSTRLNSSHVAISYAVFCVKKK